MKLPIAQIHSNREINPRFELGPDYIEDPANSNHWPALVVDKEMILIGPYSPTAYRNATSLKAEGLASMDKATKPCSENAARIETLKIELNKAYEYVRGIPKNDISALVSAAFDEIIHLEANKKKPAKHPRPTSWVQSSTIST